MSLIGIAGGALASWFTGKLGKAVVGSAAESITGIVRQFTEGRITAEERDARIQEALAKSAADVARTDGEMVAKTFATAMATFAKVPIMAKVWVVVTLSMLFVILWHALAVPAIVFFSGREWPSSGEMVLICNGVLLFNLGAGAYAIRAGQGQSGGFLDLIKKAMRPS